MVECGIAIQFARPVIFLNYAITYIVLVFGITYKNALAYFRAVSILEVEEAR